MTSESLEKLKKEIEKLKRTGNIMLGCIPNIKKEIISDCKHHCEEVWELMMSQCEEIGEFNKKTLHINNDRRDLNDIENVGEKWKQLEQLCLQWLRISRFIWSFGGKKLPEYWLAYSHAGENKEYVMALKNQLEKMTGWDPSLFFIDKEMVHGDSIKNMQQAFANCEFGFVKMTEYSVCKPWPLIEQLIFRARLANKEEIEFAPVGLDVLNNPDTNFTLIVDAVDRTNWGIIGDGTRKWIDVVKRIANPFYDNFPCAITSQMPSENKQIEFLASKLIKIIKMDSTELNIKRECEPNSQSYENNLGSNSYPTPSVENDTIPYYQHMRVFNSAMEENPYSIFLPEKDVVSPILGRQNSSMHSAHRAFNIPSVNYRTNTLPGLPGLPGRNSANCRKQAYAMSNRSNTYKPVTPSRNVPESMDHQLYRSNTPLPIEPAPLVRSAANYGKPAYFGSNNSNTHAPTDYQVNQIHTMALKKSGSVNSEFDFASLDLELNDYTASFFLNPSVLQSYISYRPPDSPIKDHILDNQFIVRCLQADFITLSVAKAMMKVPRSVFAPVAVKQHFYAPPIVNCGITSTSPPNFVCGQIQALELSPGERVLDIGCGTGWTTCLASVLVGQSGSIVALDLSADIINYARTHVNTAIQLFDLKNLSKIDFIVCNVLSFPNSLKYDKIICGVSCTQEQLPKLVALLKPEGIMVLDISGDFVRVRGSGAQEKLNVSKGACPPIQFP